MQVAVLNRDQLAEVFLVDVSHYRGYAERRAEIKRGDMDGYAVLHAEQGHPLNMVLDGIRMRRFFAHCNLDGILAAERARVLGVR